MKTEIIGGAVGVTALIAATWGVFLTFPTFDDVAASEKVQLEELQDVAGSISTAHKLDTLDAEQKILLLEIKYLEQREAADGITPSEARELDRLKDKLESYQMLEETIQAEMMKAS